MEWSRYLVDERMMMFHPYVAKAIGLNEAIFLQQLHYWLNRKPHIIEEKGWVYNPYKAWQEQLCFMSEKTIRRTIKNLVDKGIVITANFNSSKYDRTLWYSIDYDKLDALVNSKNQENVYFTDVDKMATPCGQNDQMNVDKMTPPIPSITHKKEIYKENPPEEGTDDKEDILIHDFEIIYSEYPRKEGKNNAFKAYKAWKSGKKILGKTVRLTNEEMYNAVLRYKEECMQSNREKKYIKQADTFFRNINEYVEGCE